MIELGWSSPHDARPAMRTRAALEAGVEAAAPALVDGFAREHATMIGKTRIGIALCDHRLLDDLHAARAMQPGLAHGRAIRRRRRQCVPDRVHLRAGCGAIPTAHRRVRGPAGEDVAGSVAGHHPRAPADSVLHRADRLPRDARGDAAGQCGRPAPVRVHQGGPAGGDLAPLARLHRDQADGWHELHGDAAHLHRGPVEAIRPWRWGYRCRAYEAKRLDDEVRDLRRGATGRLAVHGPTGCRYLADERQLRYVVGGWNVTGGIYRQDKDGHFSFRERSHDMIVSSGYNIAGPKVEAAMLTHPAVAECAVIGAPDDEHDMVVKAFVVVRDGVSGTPDMARAIKDYVTGEIAPYKYPREIEFMAALPRTELGKLQRFRLRQRGLGNDGRLGAGAETGTRPV